LELRVAHHGRVVVASVDLRLEDLDLLFAVERSLDAANQLLGLAGEHRAADDLYPPDVFGELVHGRKWRGPGRGASPSARARVKGGARLARGLKDEAAGGGGDGVGGMAGHGGDGAGGDGAGRR